MAQIALVFCIVAVGFAGCWAKCGQLLDNKVSANDKNAIINTHNYFRGLIMQGKVPGQPRGKNLKTLKWDDSLAKEAQTIANLCEFRHVAVKDSRFYVGQNLALGSSTAFVRGADWKGVIQSWFNEYKNFKYPTSSTGVTGHYTQVVWADTYFIGCGYTQYHKSPNAWYDKLYVCNYGPGGNIIGQAPYTKA